MDSTMSDSAQIREVIDRWTESPENRTQMTTRKKIDAVKAQYSDTPQGLDQLLLDTLSDRGIERLYSHQSESITHTLSGKNVVVVTPTASGKTLCYNLPVLSKILSSGGRALYLFPTKALAQDQLMELTRWEKTVGKPISAYTYDGDTSGDKRAQIRKKAKILITNPDMLHLGILPHHTRWATFLSELNYIVIDELHIYRGVFGSHFANLLRRLKRISKFYSASPQYICCSATIANPQELARNIIDEDVELVNNNGAPSSEKEIIFFNPPIVNPELGIRANYLRTARTIARFFLKNFIQTLVFATSRMNVEIILKYLKEDFAGLNNSDDFVKGYRGGYLPSTRRTIERGLREGNITGVIATNALELGIDIGGLDACVIAGYPGSIASTWQQAGRVGRRSGNSVVILVARSSPIDQFIINFPDYFFGRSPEHGLVNPDNLHILVDHLICAAFELPINPSEKFGKEDLADILEYLEEKGILHKSGENYHFIQDKYPAAGISLRNIGSNNILVVDKSANEKVIAEVDNGAAHRTLFKNAVYLHEGNRYLVEELDLEKGRATVRRSGEDYYTIAISQTNVNVLGIFDVAMYGSSPVEHGEIELISETTGFKKVKFYTGENLGEEDLDLPIRKIQTTAYWFTVKEAVTDKLDFSRAEIIDGIMGISNVLVNIASLILMCDRSDLGVSVGDRSAEWFVNKRSNKIRITKNVNEKERLNLEKMDVFEPAIYLYDSHPGGIGFSPVLFHEHSELLSKSAKHIAKCQCLDGCPSCVGPMNEIGMRGKEAAQELLKALLVGK